MNNNGMGLLNHFFDTYLIKRDQNLVMELLTEDITWIGTGPGEEAFGADQVSKLLRDNIESIPEAFSYELFGIHEQLLSKESFHYDVRVNAKMKRNPMLFIQMRVSCSMKMEEGHLKICSFHSSLANELQENGEFFPTSYLEQNIRKIMENYNSKLEEEKIRLDIQNEELRQTQEIFRIAYRQSKIYIWKYDIIRNVFHIISGDVEDFQFKTNRTEYTFDEVLKANLICPESVEMFLAIHEEIRGGANRTEGEIFYRNSSGEKSCCLMNYIAMKNEKGKAIYAIGCMWNITEQKTLENRYYEEIQYRKFEQKNYLVSFWINLTKDKVMSSNSNRDYTDILCSFIKASDLFEYVVSTITEEEERNTIGRALNIPYLINQCRAGRTEIILEYLRTMGDGKPKTVRATIRLMSHPVTGEIQCFVYTTDISRERILSKLINGAVKADYDYLAYIDGRSQHYEIVSNEVCDGTIPETQGEHFDSFVKEQIKACVMLEDQESLIKEVNLSNVIQQLQTQEDYLLFFHSDKPDGFVHRKKMRFSFLDKEKLEILLTINDITHIYEEDQKKNQALEAALLATKHANMAKTDFLSRMSHEIRTPMNAIIGMSALAKEHSNEIDTLMDCINKIDVSAKYLLSLLNDILDMNKIESGKVYIIKEKIDFPAFLEKIHSMFIEQANKNGILYEENFDENLESYYLADEIKLQQIIVNLLSNAIKFTPEGGKVCFSIQVEEKQMEYDKLRVVITDTGCGIKSQFLPALFEPFTQEHSSKSEVYGGTGLGLAICKSLIDLMDGSIYVESKFKKGSKFIVRLNLERIVNQQTVAEKAAKERLLQMEHKEQNQMNFIFLGKRILVVEDHPLNIEVATRLLEKRGFVVHQASNGQEALEMFIRSQENYYQVILMDIRMPVLDGLEATAKIRSLDREDAQTVPIIAMTANAFDLDKELSKQAGMNAHLAKPIEPVRLFETLRDFLKL